MTTDRDTLLTVAALLDKLGTIRPLTISTYGESFDVHLTGGDLFTVAQEHHAAPIFEKWNGGYVVSGFYFRGVHYFALRSTDELSDDELNVARGQKTTAPKTGI